MPVLIYNESKRDDSELFPHHRVAEDAVGEVLGGAEDGLPVDVVVHLFHVQQGEALRDLQNARQLPVRRDGPEVRQVQVGVDAAVLLEEVEVTEESRILTMSTCIANKPDNRFLVQGVLLNGE